MDNQTAKWQSFALLLIDVQNDFWDEDLPEQFPAFPERTAQLLAFCRAQGLEIIHVRASFQPDMSDWMARYRLRKRIPCVAGTLGIEVLPFAREIPGEKVILKHSFDGFLAPELDDYLRQAKKRFLLTAGLVTSTCVLLTTASAMQRGYLTAVVEDCCADEPLRHAATLDAYPFIFARTKVALLESQYEEWVGQIEALEASREG